MFQWLIYLLQNRFSTAVFSNKYEFMNDLNFITFLGTDLLKAAQDCFGFVDCLCVCVPAIFF